MKVKVRMSTKDLFIKWGLVEKFGFYKYKNEGYIESLACVTVEGRFVKPRIMKGEKFLVPTEVDIDNYIKAKKPFYSILDEGFIMNLKAGINYDTGEFLEDKSTAMVYKIISEKPQGTSGYAIATPVSEVPEVVIEMAKGLMKELVEAGEDRKAFLMKRLGLVAETE